MILLQILLLEGFIFSSLKKETNWNGLRGDHEGVNMASNVHKCDSTLNIYAYKLRSWNFRLSIRVMGWESRGNTLPAPQYGYYGKKHGLSCIGLGRLLPWHNFNKLDFELV